MRLVIEESARHEDIEKLIDILDRTGKSGVEPVYDLVIPLRLQSSFMGISIALCQLAFSWIRYTHKGKLILDVSDPASLNEDLLMESEYLFPVVMLAWNNIAITDPDEATNLKPYLRESVGKIREYMVKANMLKGWKLLLTSIDHFPAQSGMIPSYENAEGFIDNEKNTLRNLTPALYEILGFSKSSKENFKTYEEDFVAIIHELVKNTSEWGKTDQHEVPVDPGVRGVLVKFYKKRRATFLEEFKKHPGLKNYFNSPVLQENISNELYFLEISVFDSGIGFVEKYKSITATDLSDIDIIKRCLIRHMTSAKGLGKDDKGIGLDRILNVLDNKGFLRIRTGHSCLYRDLIHQPYKQVNQEADLELMDWDTHKNNDYRNLGQATGSTLTILYPLATNPAI